MNNKALTLSLFMAIVAVFFVQSYVSSIEDEQKKRFGTEVLVLKATRNIKEMETINETMFEPQPVPKRFLQPAAIFFEQKSKDDPEVMKSMKALVGTIAMVPIEKGEQIASNKITEPGVRTGLAPQVTPGKRAVAIQVNEMAAVGKLLKPGDRVDLLAVLDPGGGGKESRIVKTLFQDVVVLATGRNVTGNVGRVVETDMFTGKEKIRSLQEDSSFGTVTLEVDPMQAQVLALVTTNPDNIVTLSLRNNDDTDRTNLGSIGLLDLLGPDLAKIQAQRGLAGRR